jgi:hypothetical protein
VLHEVRVITCITFEVIEKLGISAFAIESGAICAHSTGATGLLPIQFKATSNPANDCDYAGHM